MDSAKTSSVKVLLPYFLAASALGLPAASFLEAGLTLPKEPLNIFPFLVFLSPRPSVFALFIFDSS